MNNRHGVLVSCLSSFLLLTSCLTDNPDPEPDPDPEQNLGVRLSLEGTWQTTCWPDQNIGSGYGQNTVVVVGAGFYFENKMYTDSECLNRNAEHDPEVTVASLSFGDRIDLGNDDIADEVDLAIFGEEGVIDYYQLLLIEETQFFFGDDRGENDGDTLAKRPTQIDTTNQEYSFSRIDASAVDLKRLSDLAEDVLASQRFYGIWLDDSGFYQVTTTEFSNGTVKGYRGYIEESDGLDPTYETTYTIQDGQLFSWWGRRNVLHTANSEFFLLCSTFEQDTSIECELDDHNADWFFYTKEAAKAWMQANTAGGTDINMSLVTDSALNEFISIYEYDFVENVEWLYADEMGIESIAGIGQFTNLTSLSLSNNHISNISELSTLTDLEFLDISYQTDSLSEEDSNISNYTPLYSLSNLTDLRINESEFNRPEKFEFDQFLAGHNDVSTIVTIFMNGIQLDDDDLVAITGLSSLEWFIMHSLPDIDISLLNNDWSSIKGFVIDIDVQNAVNNELDITELINDGLDLSEITRLEFTQVRIDDSELSTLASGLSNELQSLKINTPAATTFDSILNANLPSVTLLDFYPENNVAYDLSNIGSTLGSAIESLTVSNGTVTNLDIESLTNLNYLELRGVNVTDQTFSDFVASLEATLSLTEIQISSSQVNGSDLACADLTLGEGRVCEDG